MNVLKGDCVSIKCSVCCIFTSFFFEDLSLKSVDVFVTFAQL